jgi:hypothetical protein
MPVPLPNLLQIPPLAYSKIESPPLSLLSTTSHPATHPGFCAQASELGSSHPQQKVAPDQQRHTGNNILRLKQMPMCERHLGARPNRHSKDMFIWKPTRIQSSEHILISEVVSKTEHELRGLADFVAVGGDEPFDDLAFVDEGGAHFKVGFAGHDFDIPFFTDGVFELFLAFASHVGAEFGVGGPVMPC